VRQFSSDPGTTIGKVVSPLELVRQRTAAVREAEEQLRQQREELREAVIYAHREGVPISRIAREAGLSRQYVSGIVHGR
jgi:hypothetical protein